MKFILTAFLCLSAIAAAAEPNQVLHNTNAHVLIGGSGAIIQSPFTKRKYLLTNWHVCNLAPDGAKLVSTMETGEPVVGKVVYKDAQHDLCLLEVDQRRLAIPVGQHLNTGDRLFTHGYPKGKLKYSEGVFEYEDIALLNVLGSLPDKQCPQGFEAKYNVLDLLVGCYYPYPTGMTTLYAAPGSSGSAVVNSEGELVGVIQSAVSRGGNDAGIITLPRIREFMKGL